MASFGNNNGDSNVIGIMKTSDGSTVTTATVSSIDVSNGQLGECQFTPGGKLVYSGTKYWATNDPNHPTTGSLFVFDTKTLNLVETIETPAAPNSYAMHIFSDGSAYNVGSSPTAVRVQLDPSYMGAVAKKTKTAKASVVFAAKKSILSAAAKKSLNTVATKYKKSASKIVVTASAPSATAKAKDKNAAKALASKRATAVKNYLKSKGIAVKKITVKTVVVVTKGKKMTAKLKKSVETSNLVITYKG